MKTASRLMWATVGVGAFGVLAGIGLMQAGDWLGRRDEQALRGTLVATARASSAAAQPTDVTPAPQVLEAAHGTPFELLSQLQFVPHLEEALHGLEVTSVADAPWAQQIGVQAGDLVVAINDQPVLEPEKLSQIAAHSRLELTIRRAGQELTLSYQIL